MILNLVTEDQAIKREQEKSDRVNKRSGSRIDIKKGETVSSIIANARRLVEEKLKNYKNMTNLVTTKEGLYEFFNEVEENAEIAIDTETTGLNTYEDELVGICLYNGKHAVYVPLNHKSAIYRTRLDNSLQMSVQDVKAVMKDIFNRHYKWIYHNAKFDLSVLRTFFGYPVSDPYWDTLIAAYLLDQDEDHGLKALYNKYVAVEDERSQ